MKSIPSVFASPRIDSIESSTELMKHAEHCGAGSKPQLNQTGELNAPRWPTRIALSSAVKMAWSFSVAKYLPSFAPLLMVSATRPIICRMLDSRSGVPRSPRMYLSATMSVACCDQLFGVSTSFCSKTVPPLLSLMAARRFSHSISSNGSMPSRLNRRSKVSPGALVPAFGSSVFVGILLLPPGSSWSAPPGARVRWRRSVGVCGSAARGRSADRPLRQRVCGCVLGVSGGGVRPARCGRLGLRPVCRGRSCVRPQRSWRPACAPGWARRVLPGLPRRLRV